MSKPKPRSLSQANGKLRLVYLDAKELRDNPANWREHPQAQIDALEAVIDDVGWAGVALINERRVADGWVKGDAKPTLIDGHARKKYAVKRGVKVPAVIGHWTPEQERQILRTLDPLAAMATANADRLQDLLNGWQPGERLAALKANLEAQVNELLRQDPSNVQFKEYDESVADEVKTVICPNCGHTVPI